MENMVPFAFGDHLVRIVPDENGEPWFVAKDVAKALDYEWNGASRIAHVPEEWRGVTSVVTPSGTQEMLTLSEQGLYFFLGRSDKPKALPFQKWLAGEVVPSIRKTGRYISCPGRPPLPEDMPEAALALKPAMRQRLWRDALDTARLDGGDTAMAIAWFDRLCRLMTCEAPLPSGVSPLVAEFVSECCVKSPGSRIRAATLYEAMRTWAKGRDMPSMKVFGESMTRIARNIRSNGRYYLDITLR